MDRKSVAVKYDAFGGKVVFYFMPFESFRTESLIKELRKVVPDREFLNTRNGETSTDMPDAYENAMRRAEQARDTAIKRLVGKEGKEITAAQAEEVMQAYNADLKKSGWRVQEHWSNREKAFCICVGNTVDIEFGDNLPPEAQALRLFWEHRNVPTSELWQTFLDLIGEVAYHEWTTAYVETRQKEMKADNPAEPEATTDPNS